MNAIIPYKNNRNVKTILASLIVIVVVSTLVTKFVLADNQSSTGTIDQMNAQINEIDKKLMVNSQSWNDLEKDRLEIIAKQEFAMTGNNKLREEKQKLIADKEAKLLWK